MKARAPGLKAFQPPQGALRLMKSGWLLRTDQRFEDLCEDYEDAVEA
jgi:hypothetical protein